MSTMDANDMLAQFAESLILNNVEVTDIQEPLHNYCPDCNTPMELALGEYRCGSCGLTQHNELGGVQDHSESVGGSLRVMTSSGRGRFYGVTGDYARVQRKAILDQLLAHASQYTGLAFQVNILHAVAHQYNTIQKLVVENDKGEEGKFVRRGSIKNEVLAALIYFECIRAKLIRKKKDIATFMDLSTYGFPRGEDILRTLHAEGKIDIPVNDEPMEGYVDRYLETLNIENPNYRSFIMEVVELSEKRKIGMHSQIASKVVGTIWVLITKLCLKISAATLEQAADNTKKNTFVKFYNVIFSNIKVFTPLFKRYGIPLK
jgi:hypothetical protein